MSTAVLILAAGHGSRMKSDRPKVLHHIGSVPMLWHAMQRAQMIKADKTIVVVGHGGEAVEKSAKTFDKNTDIIWQKQQKGTGHAVQQAADILKDFAGDVIILYGDTPFIRPQTLRAMQNARAAGNSVVVLGFEAKDPAKYGRLMMEGDQLDAIIEAKDCTEAQLDITFCNSGVIAAPAKTLFSLLNDMRNDNASGEFYLTDIVAIARAQGLSCTAISCEQAETQGINSRHDLATAEAAFQQSAQSAALDNGVTLTTPQSVHFAFDTDIAPDVTIEPNVFFGPGVLIQSGTTIHAFSHLEGCHIGPDCQIGPYARLRPGTTLKTAAKVGNFVEIKAADIKEGAKVNHLTYVGDAAIGAGTNIGAGTIFCNYDGANKYHIEVGNRVFIGSNSALVAPLTIKDDAFVATGSVITDNVPDAALAIARTRQINKPGLGKRLMEKAKAIKAAKTSK